MKKIIFLLFAVAVTCSCRSKSPASNNLYDATGPQPAALSTTSQAKILVGNSQTLGQLAILNLEFVKNTPNSSSAINLVKKVSTPGSFQITSSRSKFGFFYLALKSGRIIVVDSETGAIKHDFQTKGGLISDIEIASQFEVFVAFRNKPLVKKIDIRNGAELQTTNLASGILKKVSGLKTARIFLVGESLFVGIDQVVSSAFKTSFLSIINQANGNVKDTFELSSPSRKALDLSIPFVVDPFKKRLIVAAKGKRPVDTGLSISIDLQTEKIVEHTIPGTFNGLWCFSEISRTKIILDHTSTPVPSTHVMGVFIESDGNEKHKGAPITELFEDTNEMDVDATQKVAALAGPCRKMGFCTNTQGISFIDLETLELIGLLDKSVIGFTPEIALFLK